MGLEAILVMWPGIFEQIFILTSHGGSIWHLVSRGLVFFEEKFENVESEWPWTKDNEWPWPWVVINCHVLIYLTICTNFHLINFNSFLEIYSLIIFPYKNKRDQIWPLLLKCRSRSTKCHHLNKIGSTQVINAAYQVSRSSAFWFQRKRFVKVFTIIWAWWPSWSCDIYHLYSISFSHPMEALHNLVSIGLAVSKEKKFENVVSEWPWTKVNTWTWPSIFIMFYILI